MTQECANNQVGDRLKFGRYPQGINREFEPISWRVLKRYPKSSLVISEKSLDTKPYNKTYCDITWAGYILRPWMNEEFFYRAFSEQEQSLIKIRHLLNDTSSTTDDRVFLLSLDESESLFHCDDERICEPIDYAKK